MNTRHPSLNRDQAVFVNKKKIHLIRQLPRLVATRLATEKGDIKVDVVIELMKMPHLTDKGSQVCRKCWNCKKRLPYSTGLKKKTSQQPKDPIKREFTTLGWS